MQSRLDSQEAINRIVNVSTKRTSKVSEIKHDILDILAMTSPKDHTKVLSWIIDKYDTSSSFIEKKNLSFVSPLIASVIKDWKENGITWIIYPIREKDSSGNYEIFKYQIKYWGYPQDIKKIYSKQIGWSIEWLKITDEKWIPYPENKKFSKWDIVYIKAPIIAWKVLLIREKDSSGMNRVYKYKVVVWGTSKHIQKKYVEQIWRSTKWLKITDEKWIPYPENKEFSKWDIVYIKAPIDSLEWLDRDTKEKISIQQDYINLQPESHRELLKAFNKQSPMKGNIEFSFGIPVKSYEDIDKTLASLTTKQSIDPWKYEIVLLLNRPDKKTGFDKKTKEKILKFKLDHPEYNITLFEHTFNFSDKVKMWAIYKLLWDIIVYRNIQRANIKWMDFKKIRNLIIKTWWADSTDKNPNYIKHQLDQYKKTYSWWKELIRLTWESRIPANLAISYPLLEIDEFFQRHFDLAYVKWDPLKRDVWIWSYKARAYADAGWFNGSLHVREDTGFVKRIKKVVNEKNEHVCMHHDKDFIWAVDNSTDRGIYAITKGVPYCDRYNKEAFKWSDETKDKERNSRALNNKWKDCTRCLELTIDNLQRDLSAFYKQRINNLLCSSLNWEITSSQTYNQRLKTPQWQKSNCQEKANYIATFIINPIMEQVLQEKDFMGLSSEDYRFGPIKIHEHKDGLWIVESAKIHFSGNAITKIKQAQKKRVSKWYYNYWA